MSDRDPLGCDEALALAPALPFDAIEPEELAALEAHLLGCPPCRARSSSFEGAIRPLQAAASEPAPPEVWARIAARLADPEPVAKAAPAPEQPAGPSTGEVVIALACTFCHDALVRQDAAYCASCLAPHHRECFSAHGRCSAPGCGETHVVRPAAAGSSTPRRGRRELTFAAAMLLGAGGLVAAVFIANSWVRDLDAKELALIARQREQAARSEVERLLAQAAEREANRDFSGAVSELDKALALDPTLVGAWSDRGTNRHRLGDAEGALRDFEQALQLEPRRVETRLLIARALRDVGRPEDALAETYSVIKGSDSAAVRSDALVLIEQLGKPVLGRRRVVGEVQQAHELYAWIDAGSKQGVRRGDIFAVWRSRQLVARIEIDLVRETEAGGTLTSYAPPLRTLPGDLAILTNDPETWRRLEASPPR